MRSKPLTLIHFTCCLEDPAQIHPQALATAIMAPAVQSKKRKSSEYVADIGFIDDDSDGASRQNKRTKSSSSSSLFKPRNDDSGDLYWELTKMRRVTISEFKGKQMVGIREYYEQNGKILPGKKVRDYKLYSYMPMLGHP